MIVTLLLFLGLACVISANQRLALSGDHVGQLGRLRISPAVREQAAAQIMQADPAEAYRLAASAVPAQPMRVQGLALLGSAALLSGDQAAAADAFRVAAELGWRNPTVQRYWLFTSLAAGRPDLAAQRIDALLRVHPPEAGDKAGLAALEATPAGRAALVGRMITSPAWLSDYLAETGDISGTALANRIQTLEMAAAAHVSFAINDVAKLTNEVARRDIDAAHTIWSTLGPSHSHGSALLEDGGFEEPACGSYCSIFQWRLLYSGDLTTTIDGAPNRPSDHHLTIVYHGTGRVAAAQQTLLLGSGRYQLSWHVDAIDGGDNEWPSISVRCRESRRLIDVTRSGSPTRFEFEVAEDPGCRSQLLTILAAPSSKPIRIDDVLISAI